MQSPRTCRSRSKKSRNCWRLFEPLERLNRIADILEVEIEKLNVDRSINTRVKRQMERAQKEYYLNEKLKAIQKELGRGEANEIEQLKKKIETSGMPEGPQEKAMQELKRLEMMPPMSAESTVSRNYLDWLLAVPWKKRSKEIRDIKRAEVILSEDHYGLDKIKDRILEYLAVRQLVKNPEGLDSLLPRASRRGQDFARDVHRPRHGTQVRARIARRRAR